MTSISSIETVKPDTFSPVTPSPATSASNNERTWLADETGNPRHKGKERRVDLQYDDTEGEEALQSPEGLEYPPTNEDEAETRRVEENLRRWETTERQRRKQARESQQSSSSLVGDMSRRASLLWSGRRSKHRPNGSLGTHVALQSQENISSVPLEDINASPTPSPVPTPPRRDSADPDNPFANPISPFADSFQQTSIMDPSTDIPPSLTRAKTSTADPIRPALLPAASSSFSRMPPTPKPLGLPPPRTPPPPIDTPPRPTSPPSSVGSRDATHDSPKETRWWHDWLCGCSEGPDRGGDYQAGRTNPFE